MILPHGICGIFAMARPRRPASERQAVVEAALVLRPGSARATAALIAARVAQDCVAYVGAELEDPLVGIIVELRALEQPSPVVTLSRCPHIGTASLVTAARMRRFEARSCRQLSQSDWRRETAEIVDELAAILTERYRAMLKNNG